MKVLFVCSANICRSPLAETILKAKLNQEGLNDIIVESAGIHNYESPRDYMMASYARKAGYELSGYSQKISQSLTDSADLIICMENFQIVELQRLYVPYKRWNIIHRFNEICFDEQTDVMDPSGDTDYAYSAIFQHIEEGCGILACKISKLLSEGKYSSDSSLTAIKKHT